MNHPGEFEGQHLNVPVCSTNYYSVRNDSPPCLTLPKVAVHLGGGRAGGGGGGIRGGGGVELSTGGSPHDVDIIKGHLFFPVDGTLGLQNDLVLIRRTVILSCTKKHYFHYFGLNK